MEHYIMLLLLTAGTPAQVMAAIDAAIFEEAFPHAWERLGFVGVTGVDIPLGLRSDFWATEGTIDAPEMLPLGRVMVCANAPGSSAAHIIQSAFTLRGF